MTTLTFVPASVPALCLRLCSRPRLSVKSAPSCARFAPHPRSPRHALRSVPPCPPTPTRSTYPRIPRSLSRCKFFCYLLTEHPAVLLTTPTSPPLARSLSCELAHATGTTPCMHASRRSNAIVVLLPLARYVLGAPCATAIGQVYLEP
ncbi:hypothetical protein BD309DRAFT_233919 [Dichomitus squalens]|uniref:Uncharacterized protein n=1 Tax=Dichomitus squalens TaxID=114155 RepID=A0A4Q9Q119_9APHY|nr:hypothetical protein BD309DRAFT_233919 [Dichomitus squalens]TBU60852.1 hypothetical protein BD310DRAFT_271151 [Dichomitus squalens]